MSIVDQEAKLRMNEGFKAKFGDDISDDELDRFYKLASFAKDGDLRYSPVTHTFEEIDAAITRTITRYKPKNRYAKA